MSRRAREEPDWPGRCLSACVLVGLLFVLIAFWIYPLTVAFSIGAAPTTLGLNGTAWGTLILCCPPFFGFVFLVGGGGKIAG